MTTQSSQSWLEGCLARLRKARVAVFGDFCLDAYWVLEPNENEISVETGLPVRRVRQQRYSLGGAGNVVANLAALEVAEMHAIGLVGRDPFGRQMQELLAGLNVNTEGLLSSAPDWETQVYAKPYMGEGELNRIDFGAFNRMSAASVDALGDRLEKTASAVDVLVINQQLPAGVTTPAMIERINAIVARHPRCRFIADSRHRSELFAGVSLKMNAHEAARLLGRPRLPYDPIPPPEAADMARRLARRTGQPVFVTRGEHGIVAASGDELHDVPGIPITGPVDSVGAGDSVVSALAAALGSGSDLFTAVRLANLAASVTVRKLQTTGTASPDEIRAAALASTP